MKEQDLAVPVIAWLEAQHWDVYQEVQIFRGGGIADIMATRSGLLWVIECKLSLSIAVMEQARGWHSHFGSVAVPALKRGDRYRPGLGVAKDYYKIGVITVSQAGVVDEAISPPLQRDYHRFSKEMMTKLRPEHKVFAQAGAKNGGHYTPYRATMNEVRYYISKHPGCTLKEIMDEVGKGHYKSDQSGRSSIRTALQNWESDWCTTDWTSGREARYSIK